MVVVLSWVLADVQTHQLYILNMCNILDVSYTLIILFKEKKHKNNATANTIIRPPFRPPNQIILSLYPDMM